MLVVLTFIFTNAVFKEKMMINNFVNYVLEFYGEGGIYDFGAVEGEVLKALEVRLQNHADIPFSGDSFDRELVRDIMLKLRGVDSSELEYNV